MKEYAVVRTKEQLKQALDSETRNIIVVDEGLARNIKVVKYASKAASRANCWTCWSCI